VDIGRITTACIAIEQDNIVVAEIACALPERDEPGQIILSHIYCALRLYSVRQWFCLQINFFAT
jgi:hypothetical protein